MDIRRVAICSLAAPWDKGHLLGVYWPFLAEGMSKFGVRAEVFHISMNLPDWGERIIPKISKFNDRPDHYIFQGLPIHVVRGYFPHPRWIRWNVAPRWPRLAGSLVRRAVEPSLFRSLRHYKPDALLFHDGVLLGQLARRVSTKLKLPWVIMERDPIDFPADGPMARYYAETLRSACAVFAGHRPSVEHMRNDFGLQNARVFHNGTLFPTPDQWSSPRPERWRGKTVVLHCGNYIKRKAHEETIRAFAEVNVPDCVLVMIGDPPAHLKRLVSELRLQDRVEFTPWMRQHEVVQHMVWADLFVLPAPWESYGKVYTEAMASETPVIMCSDCGLAGYIQPGVHGWIVPPRDHGALVGVLREALTQADLKAMGRAGRQLVESRWTWENNARNIQRGLRGEPDPDPLRERAPPPLPFEGVDLDRTPIVTPGTPSSVTGKSLRTSLEVRRVALLTLAAPWEQLPMSAVYWPPMMRALCASGVHAEVFYIGMLPPPLMRFFSARARRFKRRPAEYEYQGVRFHATKGFFPHPVWLRWKVAPRMPGLASRLIRRAVLSRLVRRVMRFRPDALLVHDGILLGPIGLWISRRLGIPFSVIEHDPIDFGAKTTLGLHYKRTQRHATSVFSVQGQTVRHMRDNLGLSQARVLHNGTVMPTPEQRRMPRPDKWRGKTLALHCGTYIPRKAHDLTIRAFAKVAPPNAHLIIIGPPPDPIAQLVDELGVRQRVEFLPWMSQEEVVQHMVWADLFVLPSWWESFGMVYTEAMAAQTPVIMCSDCGLANYIRHGVHGWIIPPKDERALEETLREALTRADLDRMGRAGRALVEARWTWERNAQVLGKGLRGEPEPDPLGENIPLPPEARGDRVA